MGHSDLDALRVGREENGKCAVCPRGLGCLWQPACKEDRKQAYAALRAASVKKPRPTRLFKISVRRHEDAEFRTACTVNSVRAAKKFIHRMQGKEEIAEIELWERKKVYKGADSPAETLTLTPDSA